MKTVSSWIRAALIVAGGLAMPLAGQESTYPAKPLLWKIEGNALQKPSYLFGTIHLSSPAMKDLHPAAEKAFASADALFTEIPMDSKARLELMPMLVRTDGKTLRTSIGEKMSADLDAELKAIQPELTAMPFQTMKTWVMVMTLPILKSQLQGQKALDSILWQRATDADKKQAGIETSAGQMGIFERFSEAEIVSLLGATLKQLKEDREAGKDSVADLMAAYVSGDEARITGEFHKQLQRQETMVDPELGKRFIKLILTDRNASMTATIDEKLKATPDQVNFFAVGTGHLIGEQNIGTQLSAKGYRITRIQN